MAEAWAEIIGWPGRIWYVSKPRPVEVSWSLASDVLRAWMRWDRACRLAWAEDPETGRRPFQGKHTKALERQAGELAVAVEAFARWAGVSSTEVQETMAKVRRFALLRMPEMDERLVNRWALAAVAGHS